MTNSNSNDAPASSGSLQMLLFVGVLVLAVGIATYLRMQPRGSHPAVGKAAPTLNLVKLPAPDAAVDDWSRLESVTGPAAAGNITVLHFWGTWCPPCRAEYPHLVEMMKGYEANPRVEFLPVSCGPSGEEPVEDVWAQTVKFYESNGIRGLMTYSDPTSATQISTVEKLSEPGMLYPTTMIIGPDSRIAGVWLGYDEKSLDQMKTLVDDLLAKLP